MDTQKRAQWESIEEAFSGRSVLSLTPEFLELDLYVIKAIPTRRLSSGIVTVRERIGIGYSSAEEEENKSFWVPNINEKPHVRLQSIDYT